MNDDFDELDRALFALPLEEPPAGLRRGILAATIYAAPEAPLFRFWEVVLVGAAVAFAVWLVLRVASDAHFSSALVAGSLTALRAFFAPATLAWLAAGLSTALWLSLVNIAPPRFLVRSGRS